MAQFSTIGSSSGGSSAQPYGSSAQTPIYGSSGLISGYRGTGGSNSTSQIPIYGANGLITGYSMSNPSAGSSNPNATNPNYFDPTTGLNYLGQTRGQQAAAQYTQDTGMVTQVKNPAIASTEANQLAQENQLQSQTLASFQDYLNQAQQVQQQQASSIAQDTQTAANLPGQLASNLSSAVQQYANTGAALDNKVTGINQAQADQTAANIAQANQLNQTQAATAQGDISQLGNIEQQYEDAATQAAQQAVAQGQARSNAAQSATGAPGSDSAYWDQAAISNQANIMEPLLANLASTRANQLMNYTTPLQTATYNQQMNTLTNYATPQEQQVYANQISQVTGLELPLAQALVQYGISNAQQVASLTQSLIGKSLSEQTSYLQSLGLPIQLAQQLAQSLPGTTAQLQGIDAANTNYVLAQGYTNPVGTQPTYSSGMPNTGGGGTTNNYYGGGSSGGAAYNPGNVISGTQPLQQQTQANSSPTGYYYGSPYINGTNNSSTLDITDGSLPGGAVSYY